MYLRVDSSTDVPIMLLEKLRSGTLVSLRNVAELCDGALLLRSVRWRHVGSAGRRELGATWIRGEYATRAVEGCGRGRAMVVAVRARRLENNGAGMQMLTMREDWMLGCKERQLLVGW